MTNTNFENIWKIMKEFELDMGDFNSNELNCLICKKIMVRASSGPCGCRYCFGCISQYIGEGNRNCPGTSSYCKDDIIDHETNILFDQAINSRVFRLMTQCPFESCRYKVELRKLEHHMETCTTRPENWPYFTDVRDEDKSRCNKHPTSMINDIDILKSEIEALKTTVSDLKLDFQRYQNSELQKKSWIKAEVAKWWNEENRPMTTEEESKQMDISDLQLQSDGFSRELSIASVIEWSHANLDLVLKSDQSIKEVVSKVDQLDRRISEIETNIAKQSEEEFVWIVKNISKQMSNRNATSVFSEAFYSHRNGYKMCLFVYPNGFGSGQGTHLYVGFCFMRGPFDDMLSWPCKHSVSLTLMNQRSKLAHFRKIIKYNLANHISWDKPASNLNNGLGKSHFIPLDELLSNYELIENDQIIIKCFVDIFQ